MKDGPPVVAGGPLASSTALPAAAAVAQTVTRLAACANSSIWSKFM